MLTKHGSPAFPYESIKAYNALQRHSEISHGSIVALHSEWHNRFIRASHGDVNSHGGRKDISKLPSDWGSEFLVIQVAESKFAFFSVPYGQSICMDKDGMVSGLCKAVQEETNTTNHQFMVQDEGNGKISLLSACYNRFVRMDSWGNVDGHARVAQQWEHFNVLLLMEKPIGRW